MPKVEYSSNNSGGGWWLTDEDWRNLEEEGWTVDWFKDSDESAGFTKPDAEGRWLGALASNASKEFPSLGEGIAEWERITGQSSNDLGCSCCGTPHSFSDDAGNYYSPEFPASGARYQEY